jgi:mono/diheme cytochrome c family protein
MRRVIVAGGVWMAILMAAPVSAQDGAALYGQQCASCHEGGQVARAPARDVIAALPPDRIVAALESGTMRV